MPNRLIKTLALLLCAAVPAFAGGVFRPEKEMRTINTDIYELRIQKDGQADVDFASRQPVFNNACPLVYLAGEENPEVFHLDPRQSARMEVNDPLGAGQGMVLQEADCLWYLRTYPTKTFLTVQVVYVNKTQAPVRVARLAPWTVGIAGDGLVHLGQQAKDTRILEHGDVTNVVQGQARSRWATAAYNPRTGRSLIAGFLTHVQGQGYIRLERTSEAGDEGFNVMSAECVYDPPMEVPPGGRLESEVLYLGIGEPDVLLGLERFGKASALWNGVEKAGTPTHLVNSSQPVGAQALGRFGWTYATEGTASPPLAAPPEWLALAPAPPREQLLHWYWTPHVYRAAYELQNPGGLAWMTLVALSGGALHYSGQLDPDDMRVLEKLLPAPPRPARPVDLFQERPQTFPQVWHLPLQQAAGAWDVVGLFNWDAAAETTVALDFRAVGLGSAYYTVFDYWNDRYLGTAQYLIEAKVPSNGVRLLGLRRFEDRPMLLSSSRHFSQGALDHTAIAWDAGGRELRGEFIATGAVDYTLTLLSPPPFVLQDASVDGLTSSASIEDSVVRLRFHAEQDGPLTWRASFNGGP